MNLRAESVLDIKYGNVISKKSVDKVVLLGTYFAEDSIYATNLKVKINIAGNEENSITTNIPYEGYYMQLFLADFNGDGQDEIMVRGDYGGSGGYAIASIYEFRDNKLIEIFSPNMFSKKYPLEAKYIEGKKVLVDSKGTNEKFIFDISNKDEKFLNQIYNKDGSVKKGQEPYISEVNNAFPIKLTNKENYFLLVRQRVIGVNNAGIIGSIESYTELLKNNINVVEMGSFNIGKEPLDKLNRQSLTECSFPLGTIFTKLDTLGLTEDELTDDFDGDGNKEMLVPYSLDGVPYLAVVKNDKDKCEIIDSFKGEGYKVSQIEIRKIGNKKMIFVGFELGGQVRKLEILTYNNNKLIKAYGNNYILYSQMCIKDLGKDGYNQLILWLHDSGDRYKLEIYLLKENELKKSNKYDRKYLEELLIKTIEP